MPCNDGGPRYGDADHPSTQIKLLENMLCGLCSRSPNDVIAADHALWVWWRTHQEKDSAERARLAAFMTRQETAAKAKAKLTPEEKEALGIRD